jgi:N-methylhydantoinase A
VTNSAPAKAGDSPLSFAGIDVGGTFTDFVLWRNGRLLIHKEPTTPADQSVAIVAGLGHLGVNDPQLPLQIVHGMTVATNALLERKGARTALLTTHGFGDLLIIGRQNRPELYSLYQQRPPALVSDELRLEIAERLDAEGVVLTPLDEAALPGLAAQLQCAGAESLALVLLFSYANPAHEERIAARLGELLPDLPLSISSEILPEYREYERTATTVINAYVQPLVSRYLARLESALAGGSGRTLRIMQSNGGIIAPEQAGKQAARLVLSGPAGGAVGAFAVAEQAFAAREPGSPVNLLTFDMGGTSTDVALCPGRIPMTAESVITGLPLRLPVIDIHTVGAGGGSIAFVDAGGVLQVGPRSAGALPGPVCYGRGGSEPTVTDANLVLGRLDPAGFLGGAGQIRLDVSGARQALRRLGEPLGLTAEAAALGVLRVANATMERALRTVSVEQGYDPRTFTLFPFGGAGPLHACDLADALQMRRILAPTIPGVLSAYGMLVADVSADASLALLTTTAALVQELEPVTAGLASLRARLARALSLELETGENDVEPEFSAALDLRYRGQSYELTAPLALPVTPSSLLAAESAFHAAHAQRYGYAMEGEAVESVTLRLRATLPGARPSLPRLEGTAPATAQLATRAVWFEPSAPQRCTTWQRNNLRPGDRLTGPALVLQYDATLVIPPGWSATVDEIGNLWIER